MQSSSLFLNSTYLLIGVEILLPFRRREPICIAVFVNIFFNCTAWRYWRLLDYVVACDLPSCRLISEELMFLPASQMSSQRNVCVGLSVGLSTCFLSGCADVLF